jgi:hypothetical protein
VVVVAAEASTELGRIYRLTGEAALYRAFYPDAGARSG